MDEKTPKDPVFAYDEGQIKTSELAEAASPDTAGRRQATGINIVENPLMVNLQYFMLHSILWACRT